MYSYNYLFEGSSETRTISHDKPRISGPDLCILIIQELFGKNTPPCQLQITAAYVESGETVTVDRVYAQKFQPETKKEEAKTVVPKRKRVRRWKSRSPRRRRWRSRSPVGNRYKRVYTNHCR